MQDSSVIISTALLILPGFLGLSLVQQLLGLRNRDLSRNLILSIALTILAYALLNALNGLPQIGEVFSVDKLKLITLEKGSIDKLNLLDIALLLFKALCTSVFLCISYYWAHRNFKLENRLADLTGFTSSPDVWHDFFRDLKSSTLQLYTKSGEVFRGEFIAASEEGQKRGIILRGVEQLNSDGESEPLFMEPLSSVALFMEDEIKRIVQVTKTG